VLAPIYSKTFEKILDSRLNDWLESFAVMKEEHEDFRKGFSTTDRIFILS